MSARVLETPDINLRVKFDFEYKTKDDRKISIKEGEKLFLIKKTNPDWWQVIRTSKERPFYVPATYVEESSIDNLIKSQSKANILPSEHKPQNIPTFKSDSNGTVLSKHVEIPNLPRPKSNSSQESESSEKPTVQVNESVSSKKKSEDSPEAKRILFDKRKSWAVEELMLELTQKRDIKPITTPEPIMPTAPEPEPEPDYANIYRDEHGVHIVTDNSSPGNHFTSFSSNFNESAMPSPLAGHQALPGNLKRDTGSVKPNIISKQALSKHEAPIDKTLSLVNNMSSSGGMTSIDKVAVEESNTPVSLSPTENGGSTSALDHLKGCAVDLGITRSVSTHSLLTQKRRDYEAKVSIVSLDGVSNKLNAKGLEKCDDGSYSTVAIVQDKDNEKRYSKISIVRKDSSRSLKDISGSNSKEFSRNDDVSKSQRLTKDPKLHLSDSLEKLAQQIQFGPAVVSEKSSGNSWKSTQSRSFEEELHSGRPDVITNLQNVESETSGFDVRDFRNNINLHTDEKLQTYPNKMFKKVKNKLNYSSSFKTKKEMEKNMQKNYLFGADNLDHRASVSGDVRFDSNLSAVALSVPPDGSEYVDKPGTELTNIPNNQEHDDSPKQPQRCVEDLPLNSFGKSTPMSSPGLRSPKENLAVIGEATILQNEHFTYDEESLNSTSKIFPSKENLSKIAHGFMNPSYRSISHSLDSFHDPKVLAMHDTLCTDLNEQQKLKREKKSSESLQGSQVIEKPQKSAPQVEENQGVSDAKLRNFQKLKNAIEESEYGFSKEISVGKPINVSDKKLVARNVIAFNDFQKLKVGSIEEGKYIDKAFDSMYDSHSDLKSSRSSSKASLDGDKVMKKHSSKSSLDELVSNFESRSLSISNSSLNQRKPNGSDGNRSRSDSNTSDDTILQGPESKRRTSLSRGNRVESIKERHQLIVPARPPSPLSSERPVKYLHDGWAEYRTSDGRTYYYSHAGGKSWKPPRKNKLSDNEDGSTSSLLCPDFELPPGWTELMDDSSGERCYVHQSGAGGKWFSSYNDEHKIYFFEENSNESSWTLPDIPVAPSSDTKPSEPLVTNAKLSVAKLTKLIDADQEEAILRGQRANQPYRLTKAMSMVMVPTKPEDRSPTSVPQSWPHLFDGNMVIIIEKFLREGPLHRTKITEHGKKVRKNWNSSYVVLSELFLLFFHDHKHAQALKNGDHTNLHPPEFSIDLSGAHIERGDKLSRRKNVFVITAQFGLQVLIQSDSSKTAEEWFHLINTQIALLPGKCDSIPRINTSPEENKKSSKLGRSRSVKLKRAEGSIEDLTATPEERQTKIRARLKKFFVRRPTKDSLVKKGIYKDEPMFGRNLADVSTSEGKGVPVFVTRCIGAIERKSENMKADGLYRVSGNLSQVQKIRLQADQNNLTMLEEEEDVHVLTGALKLFFRELKTPLIPSDHFTKAIKASSNRHKKERIQQYREIVKALPSTNRETLKCILQHLLRVSEFEESNRMNLPNLAIVFGPTLMWPEEESANMASDLMQQNLVIECLLQDYDSIFR